MENKGSEKLKDLNGRNPNSILNYFGKNKRKCQEDNQENHPLKKIKILTNHLENQHHDSDTKSGHVKDPSNQDSKSTAQKDSNLSSNIQSGGAQLESKPTALMDSNLISNVNPNGTHMESKSSVLINTKSNVNGVQLESNQVSKSPVRINLKSNASTLDEDSGLKSNGDGSESENDEDEFEVEKILDYSYCKLSLKGLYNIKWKGWNDEHNTWEPYSNLHCEEKLKEFYYQRLKERESATPAKKRSLEVPPDPRTNFEKRNEFLDSIFSPPCYSELETFYKETYKKIFENKTKKKVKVWSDTELENKINELSQKKKMSDKTIEELKTQLMYKHVRDTRTSQQIRLKDWEKEINQKENVKITVENDEDLEGPPRHMTYINKYMPTGGILIPDDPIFGCECESCGIKSDACCPSNNDYDFPYTKNGKLRVQIGTPIYECNKRCKCDLNCANRVAQKGRKIKLSIFRTDNGCGWGVKTLENIKRGSYIVEYVGEVITSEEAEVRGEKYDAVGRTYLFDLDCNMGSEECPYTVDAAYFGNVSHFINHSCDPNLAIFNVWIDCLDPNLPNLCLFAKRDIVKGEQLTFDYCQTTGVVEIPPKKEDKLEHDDGTRMRCRCGTAACRTWLFDK